MLCIRGRSLFVVGWADERSSLVAIRAGKLAKSAALARGRIGIRRFACAQMPVSLGSNAFLGADSGSPCAQIPGVFRLALFAA